MKQLSDHKKVRYSKIAIFIATIIWGSSFMVSKYTLDVFPPTILIAIRFSVGFILLSLIFIRRLKNLNRKYLLHGAIIGVLIFASFFAQTNGLKYTTPGKNAFLTACYCVIVPFFYWIAQKKAPGKHSFIAAAICITGIGFVAIDDSFSIGLGDALSVVGGFLLAAQIVAVAVFCKDKDPILVTIVQFGTCAAISWGVSLFTGATIAPVTQQSLLGVLYLAVVSTTFAMLIQNIGQKYVDASSASLIFSLEAVFGVLFSILFFGEQMTMRLVLGFVLIFVAILVSETKLRPRRKTSSQKTAAKKDVS